VTNGAVTLCLLPRGDVRQEGAGKWWESAEAAALQQPNLSRAFLLTALSLSSPHSFKGTERSKSELNFITSSGEKKINLKK